MVSGPAHELNKIDKYGHMACIFIKKSHLVSFRVIILVGGSNLAFTLLIVS